MMERLVCGYTVTGAPLRLFLASSVAINYAMTRTFQQPEHHIIYDAGAGSIRATLVTFSAVAQSDASTKSTSKKNGNTTAIEIKAVGYSRGTGGNELDRR